MVTCMFCCAAVTWSFLKFFFQTSVWVCMCVFMCFGQSEDRRTWLKEKFWPLQCPPIRMLNCPHAFSDALSLPATSSWNRGRAQTLYLHSSTNRLWLSYRFSDITWCGKEWLNSSAALRCRCQNTLTLVHSHCSSSAAQVCVHTALH